MTAEYEPTDLAGAAERQDNEAKTAAQKLAEEAADWRFLMTNAAGRRIVWELIRRAGVYNTNF